MSVIVKSGGGKSSGLYVWKKYNVEFVQGAATTVTLQNDGISINLYTIDNLYLKDDLTVGIQGDVAKTVAISSLLENTVIGGMNPIYYAYGEDGLVYAYSRCSSDGTAIATSNPVTAGKGEFINYVVSDNPNAFPDGDVYSDGFFYEVFDGSGAYVWRKLTAEGGDFIDFVVSDNETAYPSRGELGGFWYEAYATPFGKIVTWSGGTDDEIVAMVESADRGEINLADYWAVGDIRTVQLSAMSARGVGESHAAQKVDLVLMHAGGYNLNAAVASGRTKCSFVVGLKDSLAEAGYMNSSDTNSGSWNGSARRTWCNSVFRNAISSRLRPIFKQFKTVTAQTYNGSTNQTSVDYFALPAEREIFGARNHCNQTEYNALFQFDYYKTASNRVKKLGKTGTPTFWWERSPYYNSTYAFCRVRGNGDAGSENASFASGLAPFGCI